MEGEAEPDDKDEGIAKKEQGNGIEINKEVFITCTF